MSSDLHTIRLKSDKPPLLMLHGWGSHLGALKQLGERLVEHGDIHLIDLPGFGQSPPPPQDWSSADYADRIIRYIDEHHLKEVILLGHSFGGKVSLLIAAHYPHRVKKLVLMASAGLRRKRTLWQKCRLFTVKLLAQSTKQIDAAIGTTLFEDWFVNRFGSADYKNAGAMKAILVKSVQEDLTEEIKRIAAPTLILWGTEDDETPPEMAARLNQYISNSRLCLFPGKDHWLYEDVSSHLCARYIIPFIKEAIP